MEGIPQINRDEQYPLLKVEGGAGDGNKHPQNPATVVTTGWSIRCLPKQSWCDRWPEYVSACWMTLILLAISFLVFYGLGISAYRRQPIVLMRCNDSKQASNVYYHQIVPRGVDVPFGRFSDYLSFMAAQYPSLHFHVYFLLDDSWQNQLEGTKHSKLFDRLVPQISRTFNSMLDQNYRREIREFQRRYQNVNVSVMNLSKYMALTPLRYKWKTVPINYLPFYARIYEIWQNGGIGFDLITFSNQFNNKKQIDHRVNAILKQHNDGIDIGKYTETLNSFDREEENEFFSMFLNVIENFFNGSFLDSFLNTEYTTATKKLNSSPVIPVRRTKRESNTQDRVKRVNAKSNTTDKFSNNHTKIVNTSSTSYQTTIGSLVENIVINTTRVVTLNSTNVNNKSLKINDTKTNMKLNGTQETRKQNFEKKDEIANDVPQVLLFYDVSGYFDDKALNNVAPKKKSEMFSNFNILSSLIPSQKNINTNYVTISYEGNFVAVTSPHHPFLFQLFSAGCQRLSPPFAIKDLLWRQCSGFLMNDSYCVSIRVIYL